MKKPFVIAIAAVSGGGKTATINELKNNLKSAEALYFDNYKFEGAVEDFHQWTLDGADHNVWNLEPLKADIEKLLSESDLDYILLDYPFAYLNDTIRPYIDFAVFIDTPLDMAMARRILRDYSKAPASAICEDLSCYLSHARIAYTNMLETIRPNSDLVVDGILPTDEIVNQIIAKLPAQH